MNIRCPHCQTVFRVNPSRIPAAGVRARCSKCAATFHVGRDGSARVLGPEATGGAAPALSPVPAPASSVTDERARDNGGGRAGTDAGPGQTDESKTPAAEPDSAVPAVEQAYGAKAGAGATPAAHAKPTPTSAPASGAGGTGVPPSPRPIPVPPRPTGPALSGRPGAPTAPGAGTGAGGTTAATAARAGVFGSRDPKARAQRIARALVSDIVAYHTERRDESLEAGTLRTELRDEIMKSWEEYVAQVGDEMAKGTPYFRNALNDILAKGQALF